MRIILASKSPRRKEILQNIRLNFEVVESNYEEENSLSLRPEKLVMHLAYRKALDVAERISDEALVIGADTIVVHNGIIMGKPKDNEDSFDMLKKLSGNYHHVFSGICIIDVKGNRHSVNYESTKVKIKKLTDEEIIQYISTKEPADKAGSYGIQGIGSLIVEKIEGCYFNVMGLPVYKLSVLMRDFGVNLLKPGV
ncbi:septum formation protein Maf [Oxobacter pfennigii]|uniref:dTTP/UTP pyrophosphatase n=1 Tax=Oxobacter pfennigii TaxID=36849 RepID=A0A0P8YRM5_9CLOT|nr:Maf family protein [Oxobacter pfennigii]KPU42250.1 septum formation protein Maf [Oxobacter pfennigii]